MALIADNVCVHLSGFDILRDIDLSVAAGKVTAVVGPNGAGKSTFIKTLCGDITPTIGQVILNDQNLSLWSLQQRALMMSVLPQQSRLDFPFTASEVVSLGRIPHKTGLLRDTEIVGEALELVDAAYLTGRFFTQMSGGEKQRVQLARVLSQIWEPCDVGEQFLILDEPTSALDLSHQQLTASLVSQLARRGVGVVMVVHDLNLAASCADQVVVMHEGKIAAIGTPEAVLTKKLITDVFAIEPLILQHPISGKTLVLS
ncbi:heme ABC transporter ATP-binding protein [Porticoccaceae bacterium]|nr:heme ABC transporter ATP-binding protein [Porticoccaceae bacterium]MDB2635543.1 heme ABC transporter ATP-binding protein [Porticoccaceae bacterium]MDB2664069.1 heme ABC transporter ATP-binding protein [Porticoccaceae bacterium]